VTVQHWVDLAALGKVLGVSLVCGAGLVGVYSLGLVGIAAYEGSGAGGRRNRAGLALATACFLVVVAAVALGLWTILA
jgi:hypothetical protein